MNAIPQLPSDDGSLTPQSMLALKSVSESIAQGGVAIPEHFRNKPGAILAVLIQAMQWRIGPIGALQKTHITQGGVLGYEAQLINAIIIKNAPIKGRPQFEFVGDWTKVNGKCEERKSDKPGAGKYYVATYTKKDEEGLAVKVSATFLDEDEPREIVVTMAQAYPRFSTMWATDPAQQLSYLAIRKWARRFAPDVILGAYTPEELAARDRERDMGSVDEVPTERPATGNAGLKQQMRAKASRTATTAPDATTRANTTPPTLQDVLSAIKRAANKTEMTAAGALAERLTSDDEKAIARTAWDDRIAAGKAAARQQSTQAEPVQDVESTDKPAAAASYPEVRSQLESADDLEALDIAADLIRFVDPQFQDELRTLADGVRAKFEDGRE